MAAASLWLVGGGSSHAANILHENNEIVRVTGVEIDGELFDWEIKSGSCADVFDGCDQNSDFPDRLPVSSSITSRALLNQVVLGSIDQGLFTEFFDVDVAGCLFWNADPARSLCRISAPYAVRSLNNGSQAVSLNGASLFQGTAGTRAASIITTSQSDAQVFAVFTPSSEVPLPAAAPMLLAGLFGLGG